MIPLGETELKRLHTKQLLKRRNSLYRILGNESFVPMGTTRGHEDYYLYQGTEAQARAERVAIKAILATREHIPNKFEAKKIRQERAKKR